MRLIHRSQRARNAVRTTSAGGELFVASVVISMILSAFGDSVDPMLFGEAGLEFAIFDLAGEFSLLTMRHWHLLEFLFAGAVLVAGIGVLRVCCAPFIKSMRPAPERAIDKVPI